MVDVNLDPAAGGNTDQPDTGDAVPPDAADYAPYIYNPFGDPEAQKSVNKPSGGMTTENAGALLGKGSKTTAKG